MKSFFANFMYLSGLFRLSFLRKKKLIILCYHKIPNTIFEKQIRYLLKSSVSFVSMDEVCELITGKNFLKEDKIAITFDDGYFDNYKECYTTLKKFNIPAMIFLPTNFVGQNKIFWWDELKFFFEKISENNIGLLIKDYNVETHQSRRKLFSIFARRLNKLSNVEKISFIKKFQKTYSPARIKISEFNKVLNWQQVNEMKINKISFGSHTENHINMPSENEEIVKQELFESINRINVMTGIKPNHFAYPNGDFNDGCIEQVREAGFKTAVTTIYGFNNENTNLLKLRRISISPTDRMVDFIIKTSGLWPRNFWNKFCNNI